MLAEIGVMVTSRMEEVLAYEQLFTASFKAEPEKTMSQKSNLTKLNCIFLDSVFGFFFFFFRCINF